MVDINLLLQQFPDLQEMLKKLPLELYKNSSLKAFSPGETIVERDAPVKYVYLLLRGEANVYSHHLRRKAFHLDANTCSDLYLGLRIARG